MQANVAFCRTIQERMFPIGTNLTQADRALFCHADPGFNYRAEAFDKWTRDRDYAPGRIRGFWHQVCGLAEEPLAEAEAIRLHKDDIESCRSEIREINRQIRHLICPNVLGEAQ